MKRCVFCLKLNFYFSFVALWRDKRGITNQLRALIYFILAHFWGKRQVSYLCIVHQVLFFIYMIKGVLRNLGLILILIGAFALVICSFTHQINNVVLGCALACLIIGLISYIIINKKLVAWVWGVYNECRLAGRHSFIIFILGFRYPETCVRPLPSVQLRHKPSHSNRHISSGLSLQCRTWF